MESPGSAPSGAAPERPNTTSAERQLPSEPAMGIAPSSALLRGEKLNDGWIHAEDAILALRAARRAETGRIGSVTLLLVNFLCFSLTAANFSQTPPSLQDERRAGRGAGWILGKKFNSESGNG